MNEHIESVLSEARDVLFPSSDERQENDSILKLEMGDVVAFAVVQICLPIITGIISSALYERYATIRSREDAKAATKVVQAAIDNDDPRVPVEEESLRRETARRLKDHNFSSEEAEALADKLVDRVKAALEARDGAA